MYLELLRPRSRLSLTYNRDLAVSIILDILHAQPYSIIVNNFNI